jgi:hypothetical protein
MAKEEDMKFGFSVSFEDEAGIVVVFDCSYTYGRPAKINALPEDCYPAEGPEFDLENPMVDLGKGKTRKLTAEELEKLGCDTERDLVDKVTEDNVDDVHQQADDEAVSRYADRY